MKPACYTASKMGHRDKWIALRRDTRIEWTAHWPDIECGDSPDLSKMFWQRDHRDIGRAAFVLVYAGEDGHDNLRGALVEAGMGIAMGKTVIVVGPTESFMEVFSYGTWQYHPSVLRAKDLDEAIWMMLVLSKEEHNGPGAPIPYESPPFEIDEAAFRRDPAAPINLDDEIPF